MRLVPATVPVREPSDVPTEGSTMNNGGNEGTFASKGDVMHGTPAADGESQPASYTVVGMTCSHCVASVMEEVQAIDGIREVEVDLATGGLTFGSDQPIPREAVETAVREAGYALA
jgi:copper chaperone CopZ